MKPTSSNKIVSYSLSSAGNSTEATHYHRELMLSIESLHSFNRRVAVHVFLYDQHPASFTTELRQHDVSVHRMGSYENSIRRIRPRAWRTLAYYPVLHKWFNFPELAPFAPSQVLQLDCDTIFFDDVDLLFAHYAERDFYAREEPFSKLSHYGYDPVYLDEAALFAIARSEGASEVGPYNVGVSLLNHGIWNEIAARYDIFLSYIFRFTAWILRSPELREQLWPDVKELFALDVAEEPNGKELRFPSSNAWIVEQVALWLTLGQIPGVSHGNFRREQVRQGGEAAEEDNVVYHYFGVDKTAFVSEMMTLSAVDSARV